jgi:hypothetical protein
MNPFQAYCAKSSVTQTYIDYIMLNFMQFHRSIHLLLRKPVALPKLGFFFRPSGDVWSSWAPFLPLFLNSIMQSRKSFLVTPCFSLKTELDNHTIRKADKQLCRNITNINLSVKNLFVVWYLQYRTTFRKIEYPNTMFVWALDKLTFETVRNFCPWSS